MSETVHETSYETVHPLSSLQARLRVPGDKSLSHRSLIFGALAQGKSEISGLLESEDVHSTWRCLEGLGARISRQGELIFIEGLGREGLKAPDRELDCGNSGTTIRLLMGVLAGQPFASTLIGDASLTRRPMRRIAEPLRAMGAQIELREENFAPVEISPALLGGLDYALPVASAQLKSALLLAGLFSSAPVTLRGEIASRDHTERLLPHFGVKLESGPGWLRIAPGQQLQGSRFSVPGDPSTAAFWLAAAAILPHAEVEISGVSLNPSRLGFVRVLQRMGARIELECQSELPEPVGTIRMQSGSLQATSVSPEEIPDLIDEVPLIAVLGACALGRTIVHGAAELRIKESDRLEAVALNLRRMGAEIELFNDGFAVTGPQLLSGAEIDPHADHRIAMAFAIAGLAASGPTRIHDPGCVAISYPEFFTTLHALKGSP
ncbi:MAG: 3-phosphoshikimate 1-carboxyvinyltransferase [Candidatus Sericytochromatia bacterium]